MQQLNEDAFQRIVLLTLTEIISRLPIEGPDEVYQELKRISKMIKEEK